MTENLAVKAWRKRARKLPRDVHIEIHLDRNPYEAEIFFLSLCEMW